jgi:enoyl-CoA hydratase
MAEDQIIRLEHGGVITVRLNRPKKLNAITPSMIRELRQAVSDLDARTDLRVMHITAEGRYFSSGIDINEGLPSADDDTTSAGIRRRGRELRDLCDHLESVEKPVVLSAQGPCWGAGLELALSCDFRIASEVATFALPEVRLGLVASSGGTSRLTRLVGTGWARWLAITGQSVSAFDARMMGLVHEVHPADQLEQRVATFLTDLVSLPSEAIALAKITIGICADLGADRGRDVERLTSGLTAVSGEYQQRLREFQNRSRTE